MQQQKKETAMWRKVPACGEPSPQAGTLRHMACRGAAMSLLLITIAMFDGRITAHADGGPVQLERSDGPFVVTVFTSPGPLRAGPVDISLLIQSRENREPELDCQAFVQFRKEGAMNIRSEATHEVAQNKLFYAAQVNIPESGRWELEAEIKRGADSINLSGPITVAHPGSALFANWRS